MKSMMKKMKMRKNLMGVQRLSLRKRILINRGLQNQVTKRYKGLFLKISIPKKR